MASSITPFTNALHIIATNDDKRLAYPIKGAMLTHDDAGRSSFHPDKGKEDTRSGAVLTVNTINALYYMSGENISVFQPGKGTYSCEFPLSFADGSPNGRYLLVMLSDNGTFKAGISNPSDNDPFKLNPIPPVGAKLLGGVTSPTTSEGDRVYFGALFVPLIMLLKDLDPSLATDVDMVCEAMRQNKDLSEGTSSSAERFALFRVCDAVYRAVEPSKRNGNGLSTPVVDKGNIAILGAGTVKAGGAGGEWILGNKNPAVLLGHATKKTMMGTPKTVGEAKKMFEGFRNLQKIPAEDENFIRSFPDDFPVPKEVITIAEKYVDNLHSALPMVNFAWRGVTGYGKSTGVELLSCILGLPLMRITCHSSMEAPDFLAKFVPASDETTAPHVEMPPYEVLMFDPETAYQMITGVPKAGVSTKDCLDAFALSSFKEAEAKAHSGNQRFKLVESDFVTALTKGYIVEVQEMSTIRDAGVMVSLNEYDRPGAIIPLVDGRKLTRHERAMVVYTDNPGYAGRHQMDQAVIRRFNLIIDSYTLRKEDVIARVKYKTGFTEDDILEKMYDVWYNLKSFCMEQEYTEGDTSFMSLMYWANAVKDNPYLHLRDYAIMCMVNKATSDQEEQEKIISAVIDTNPLFNSTF